MPIIPRYRNLSSNIRPTCKTDGCPTPDKSRRSSPAARSEVAIPVAPLYLGENRCLPCHSNQHQSWSGNSPCQGVSNPIREKTKASDLTCLPCHTTGFGLVKNPNVFLRMSSVKHAMALAKDILSFVRTSNLSPKTYVVNAITQPIAPTLITLLTWRKSASKINGGYLF